MSGARRWDHPFPRTGCSLYCTANSNITIAPVAGRECYHCKLWVEEGEAHDCWTTTEAALTQDLSEELQEAWARLREAAVSLGDQRIYASGSCIMFSRATCYFFVRPKRSVLEVCVFLGRALKAPQVRRAEPTSKTKVANILQIRHRDEVEPPVTDWLQEAYELPDVLAAQAAPKHVATARTREPVSPTRVPSGRAGGKKKTSKPAARRKRAKERS